MSIVSTAPTAHAPQRSGASYAYFVIAMLMVAYLLSLMDRVLIGLMVEPIRKDLDLSDTQLGLLLGFGFVLFYSVLGVPLGALADAYNRRNIIVAGVIVWSIATAASGFAGGFVGLMIARTMVGAGEAALSPCAMSTINDRFSRDKLGKAVALYTVGGAVGIGLAVGLGGYLVYWSQGLTVAIPFTDIVLKDWRVVFLMLGAVGVPFALLFLVTVKEAPRKIAPKRDQRLPQVFVYMAQRRMAFFGLLVGMGFQVMATYIPMLWAASYFQRTHALGPEQIALPFGLIFGPLSALSLVLGGMISDRLARRGIADGPVWVVFCAVPLQIPFAYLAFTTGDATVGLVALATQVFFGTFYGGLQGVMVQLMMPPTMHGRGMAIYLLAVTVIGMGGGPLVAGALSEHVFAGANSLGLGLAATMSAALALSFMVLALTRKAMGQCIRDAAVNDKRP